MQGVLALGGPGRAMHEHYTPFDADEKQAAARAAFGKLRVIEGGEAAKPDAESAATGDVESKTGDRTGDQPEREEVAPAKSS